MPISVTSSFDNTGLPYDPTLIMTNGTFDQAKFDAYSPVFMPAALAMAYGIAFASFTAVVVHTARESSFAIISCFSCSCFMDNSVVPTRHCSPIP